MWKRKHRERKREKSLMCRALSLIVIGTISIAKMVVVHMPRGRKGKAQGERYPLL
jgi:hypothetical protein